MFFDIMNMCNLRFVNMYDMHGCTQQPSHNKGFSKTMQISVCECFGHWTWSLQLHGWLYKGFSAVGMCVGGGHAYGFSCIPYIHDLAYWVFKIFMALQLF